MVPRPGGGGGGGGVNTRPMLSSERQRRTDPIELVEFELACVLENNVERIWGFEGRGGGGEKAQKRGE